MADSPSASIAANFPKATLTPIASLSVPPTFLTLAIAQKELNANASSVHSTCGSGRHGHLALTISADAYLALKGFAFLTPVAPVDDAPAAGTTAQIAEANRRLLADQKIFNRYHNVDKALMKQLLAAIPPIYLDAVDDADFRFSNLTCFSLLQHLKEQFSQITISELQANTDRMATAWNPPTPINALFKQLKDGVRFAAPGHEPIGDLQVARIGYTILLQSGLFAEACREWRQKPIDTRTFATFQTHFCTWDMDRQEMATTGSAGYHGAAHVTAAPAPPSELALLLAEMAAMQTQVAALTLANSAVNVPSTLRRSTPTQQQHCGYCWTHGSSSDITHTSLSCHNRADGHLEAATTFRNPVRRDVVLRLAPPPVSS